MSGFPRAWSYSGRRNVRNNSETRQGTFQDGQVRHAGATLLEASEREQEEARISNLNLMAEQQRERTDERLVQELLDARRKTVRETRRHLGRYAFGCFLLAWICLLLKTRDSHIGQFLFGAGEQGWYRFILSFLVVCVDYLIVWVIASYRVPRFLRVWIGRIFPAPVRGFVIWCVRQIIPARVRQIIPADWRRFLPEWIRMYAQVFFVVFSLLGCSEVTDRASIPPAIFLSLHTVPICLLLGIPDDFCFYDCFIGLAASGILGHHGRTLRGWLWVTIYAAALYHTKLFMMMVLHRNGLLQNLEVDGDGYAY